MAAGVVVVELLLLILKVVAGVETGAGAPGVATPAGVVGAVAFVVGVALAPPNENPSVVVDAAVGVVLAFEVSGAVAVPKPLNEGAAPGGALCFFPPPSFVAGVGVVAGCEKLNAGGAAAAGAFVDGATVDMNSRHVYFVLYRIKTTT